MEVRNRTHGSGESRSGSRPGQSRHDSPQPASARLAERDPGRNVENRNRCDPLNDVPLPRKALMGGARATPTAAYLLRIRRSAEPPAREPTAPASRGITEGDRELLAMCSLFRALAADARAALIAHAHIRICATDESIFAMGSPGDSMVVVLSGRVRLSVASPDGREIVLAILVAGEIFGDIALLDGKERNADARAASQCRLAILGRRDVQSFFEQYPQAWLCQTDQQLTEMALLGLPARLAKALLRRAAMEPHPPNEDRSLQVRLTQREIGHLVGATRESVNKWLADWQRKGIVRTAESLVTIVNRHALEDLAQFQPEPNRDLGRQTALSNGQALGLASP